MNDNQLQELVSRISTQYFGKEFRHQARFNYRLQTTGGRYLLKSHDIELNPKYYQERGESELIGIIKHELCHYHLHLEGKGYQHRDRDFRDLLKQVDAPRFCKPLDSVQVRRVKTNYFYQCKDCMQKYARKRKVNTNKYVCGKCKGRLLLLK